MIEGTREILASEFLTASQALHFRPQPGLSNRQSEWLEAFRMEVPPQDGDVEQSSRMRAAVRFLSQQA